MTRHDPESPHPLDDPHPRFLDLLGTNPERALEDFATFAYRLFQAQVPRVMRALDPEARKEVIQEVLLHCASRPEVLRAYIPRPGVPFAAWLLAVASNRAISWLRSNGRPALGIAVDPAQLDRVPSHERDASWRTDLALLCVREQTDKCQLLLEMFLLGYHAQEIAECAPSLMDLPDYSNRQASDDLRYCKRCVRQCLGRKGWEGRLPWELD